MGDRFSADLAGRVGRARQLAHALARRKALACCFVFCLVLTVRLALLPVLPIPVAAIQDEHSYLLAADTFAHGRLANPVHPFWQHFETFHTLQQPTYASKYPPAQGMAMALGEKLGDPWFGVCLSMALLCGLLCWMLQGWLTPVAAFSGALIAVIQIGITSYWMNSYWGGAVAGIGGVLVLGALGRLRRKIDVLHSVLFFLGAVILANSRPYEGAVFVGLTSATLLYWAHQRKLWRGVATRFLPVGTAALILLIAGMAYYNYRVTGDPKVMPYAVYERQYSVCPAFLWGGLRPLPQYRHEVMRRFTAEYETQVYETNFTKPATITGLKILVIAVFFIGNPLLLPPLLIPGLRKSRKMRPFLLILGIFGLALLIERFILPHYAAPAAGLFFLLYAAGWRRMRYWRYKGKPLGMVNAYVLVGVMLLNALAPANVLTSQPEFARTRGEILSRLNRLPGKHLVFVRYAPDHIVHNEWVSNAADIDASHIVWSRELNPESDRALAHYFHDRDVWLLEPDGKIPQLRPYREMARR